MLFREVRVFIRRAGDGVLMCMGLAPGQFGVVFACSKVLVVSDSIKLFWAKEYAPCGRDAMRVSRELGTAS